MTLPWNIVAKNMNPHEQLQRKLREKITKLERHLQHFPPDAVHLQVGLDRNAKKALFTAALTLRLPSNVLRCTKTASDPVPALDQAVKALLRELASLKSDLRREAAWKPRERRQDLRAEKPLRFALAPLAPGEGPQTFGDLVRQMVKEHYGRLLYHVRLQIWQAETEGTISRNAIDAEAVADEVVRQAISHPEKKPEEQTYRLWLYALAKKELDGRYRKLREQAVTDLSLEADPELPNTASSSEGVHSDERISLFGERLDWAEVEARDFFPDNHALPPDAAAADSDLIDYLRTKARDWPREERNVFELHFLEGFEPDEVAMLERVKTSEIQARVKQVQLRLKDVLAEAMRAKTIRQPKSRTR